QPIRTVHALREVGSRILLALAPADLRIVARVDKKARQRLRVELDVPSAIRAFAHEHVGHNGHHGFRSKGKSWFWSEGAYFGKHLRYVLGVESADGAKAGQGAARDEMEPAQHGLHGRIKPVFRGELQSQ